MKKLIAFVKKETVLCIACLLAGISMCIVPPDAAYSGYVDFRTLGILFSLMTVMAGLQGLGVFRKLAETCLHKVKNLWQLVLLLVMLCFFSSMLITNDVALITFVPFTLIVLEMVGLERMQIPIIALQTAAANLGSMFTPIGNPQNLYLYGLAGMELGTFLRLMLPYTAVSLVLILLWSLQYLGKKNVALTVDFSKETTISSPKKLWLYLILFVLSLLTVARLYVDDRLLTVLVLLSVLLLDRQTLKRVDYSLLVTFVGFFVFIGNMGRIPAFHDFLERIIAGNETLTAALSSQVISNVPAALLLSGFTEDVPALIIGTNLGGLGTLIASMASLISFKLLARENGAARGRYLGYFTVVNLAFLAVLLGMYYLLRMAG